MEVFNKHKGISGKTDSFYLYVLFNCPQNKLQDHIRKQIEKIDRVSDNYKRKLFLSRYYLLRDLITQNTDTYVHNSIIFINDEIATYALPEISSKILQKYSHQEITYKCDNNFDLTYLEDLLFNDKPYHVFHVKDNNIDYIQMTKSKKNLIVSKESRSIDLKEFIKSALVSNSVEKSSYVVYGVSSKLKLFEDTQAYAVIQKHLRDEELIEIVNRIDQENILVSLDEDLLMMHDQKTMNRVVFKKEILTKIKHGLLSRLYIDTNIYVKFVDNMKKLGLDTNFEVRQVDTNIKSFSEGREKTISKYDGVVGITYY